MADASERSESVTTSPLPTAPPPVADVATDEPYRPLSLLAVFGFGLAVLYAVLVLLGGLVPLAGRYPRLVAILFVVAPLAGAQAALLSKDRAMANVVRWAAFAFGGLAGILGLGGLLAYSGSSPWVLGAWGMALVATAVVLCWLARMRIAESEGTLSGGNLAKWGLTASLFFGLVYAAYSTANEIAVRGQSREQAEKFIQLLQKGDDPEAVVNAFVQTLEVKARPQANVRDTVEVQYNAAPPPGPEGRGAQSGPLSRFGTMQLVRLLQLPDTKVTFVRTDQTVFERGGYDVILLYKLETVLGAYELLVGTKGQEVTDGAGSKRAWNVNLGLTGLRGGAVQTPENEDLEAAARGAYAQVQAWAEKLRLSQPGLAYLDTLPEEQRREILGNTLLGEPAVMGASGLALAGGWGARSGRMSTQELLKKFDAKALVDRRNLWAMKEDAKAAMAQEVSDLLMGTGKFAYELTAQTQQEGVIPPLLQKKGDKGEFSYPFRVTTFLPGQPRGRFAIEGEVVVAGPLKAQRSRGGVSPYQIVKLRLIRGQKDPDMSRGPGPGGPGG